MKYNFSTEMTPFIRFLSAAHPLPPDVVELIDTLTETLYLNRGETLFNRGKIVHKFCFVETGTLAAYRPSKERLIPTRFWLTNQIIFTTDSLLNNTPLPEKIVALEDCTLNTISYNKLQVLLSQHPPFYNTLLQILANEQLHYVEFAFMMCTGSYEERFNFFKSNYNKLFNLIPADTIAAFLNMSGSKLSRLRRG